MWKEEQERSRQLAGRTAALPGPQQAACAGHTGVWPGQRPPGLCLEPSSSHEVSCMVKERCTGKREGVLSNTGLDQRGERWCQHRFSRAMWGGWESPALVQFRMDPPNSPPGKGFFPRRAVGSPSSLGEWGVGGQEGAGQDMILLRLSSTTSCSKRRRTSSCPQLCCWPPARYSKAHPCSGCLWTGDWGEKGGGEPLPPA